MEHSICMNTLSLPAPDREKAYELLLDACYGMLELNTGNDRFALYFDDKNNRIYDCLLAEHYTYSDFLDDLEKNQLVDLLLTLQEAEDKSPALDHLSEDDFSRVSSFAFYLQNEGYNSSMDILGIAWVVDGVLLSLRTETKWAKPKVSIARWNEDEHREDRYSVRNISTEEHGIAHKKEIEDSLEISLEDVCPQCVFTDDFNAWYGALDDTNSHRVYNKIQLAIAKDFSGGEPLFKTLEDAGGMRELRLSAYPGGAIRVLFGTLPDQKQAILLGFIKKSDKEGYKTNIKKAKSLWDQLLTLTRALVSK